MAESNTVAKKKGLFGKIVGGILFGLVAFFIVFQVIGQIGARSNNGIPTYGPYHTFRVATDSMAPTYKVNTMIFVKDIDASTLKSRSAADKKDGDTITFVRNHGANYAENGDKRIITHRIISIEVGEDGLLFRTLGDNLNAMTCPPAGCTESQADWVKESDILGKVVGQSYILGALGGVMANPIFMMIFIIVPLLFIFGSSLIQLFKELKEPQTEGESPKLSEDEATFAKIKEQEKLKMMIELEKERMRKELEDGGSQDGEEK